MATMEAKVGIQADHKIATAVTTQNQMRWSSHPIVLERLKENRITL